MISVSTQIVPCDNSGARLIQCIRISSKKYYNANCGDLLIVIIKKAKAKKKVKVGEIRRAVYIRSKRNYYREKGGFYTSFTQNGVVLVDKNNNPIGSRLYGPVLRELRSHNYLKILHMAPCVF